MWVESKKYTQHKIKCSNFEHKTGEVNVQSKSASTIFSTKCTLHPALPYNRSFEAKIMNYSKASQVSLCGIFLWMIVNVADKNGISK